MPVLFSDLIEKARQANRQFTNAIQTFQDAAIATELKNIPLAIDKSLVNITKLSEIEELKNTLESDLNRIRKLIEAKRSFIESKGANYLDKVKATELLENISTHYLALYEFYHPRPTLQVVSRWQDDRLRLEQQLVCKKPEIIQALKELLLKIKDTAEINWLVPNECFISYAWANKATEHEKWVQPFLVSLRDHLRLAGINALLDIKDCAVGSNIYQYMDKVKQSDWVIIAGTESLFQKHTAGVSAVCNELVLINQNRAEQRSKTLPILLSGTFENALPSYFTMYTNITNWRERSYIANLKGLLASIYKIHLDNSDYQELWTEFEQQYPVLVSEIPEEVVIQQLAEQEKLNSQQKEFDVKQATELFESLNQNMLSRMQSSSSNQETAITINERPAGGAFMGLQYGNFKAGLKADVHDEWGHGTHLDARGVKVEGDAVLSSINRRTK